ncbi:AtpZ/AtpI family protein [Aeromicrobium sp.]|nr:AtpZ/AtpI family protein [Candidatus Saccharibacteria bacterium]
MSPKLNGDLHRQVHICYSSGKMKTTAAHSTPPTQSGFDAQGRPSTIAAASNLVWQLAVVVLLPILAGAKLDDVLDSKPLLTVIGFAIGAIGMSIVVWRQMKAMSPVIDPRTNSDTKEQPK